MDFTLESQEVALIEGGLARAKQDLEREQEAESKATTALKAANDAQVILQHIAQSVQQRAHQRISQVVSSCLSAVFEHPYQFKIVFERKRGRTEANLRFIRGNVDVDPMSSAGGGMIDVAAFALRVACLVMHRPRLSRVVILDEPFRFVSVQYQDNVRTMLEQLSQDLKIQIVFITHNPNLATGKIIELE